MLKITAVPQAHSTRYNTPMLSVVLAVFNEADTLGECLASVKGLADEIVVVDGGSTDRTVEIAKAAGARVISTTNPPMFHINKQKALDAAKGDWILQLDADERVSEKLREQVLAAIKEYPIEIMDMKKLRLFQRHQELIEQSSGKVGTGEGHIVAYFIPRLNYFLGGWLRHGGVYPDGAIRLVKKGKAKFPCKDLHEMMQVDGRVAWLSEDLLHYADPTVSRYLQRWNRYTTFIATQFRDEKLNKSIATTARYLIALPLLTFFSLYLRHKAILDGFPGFVWSLFSALRFPVAYMKYWELHA
jgi:glycosyltransferase involved in cell wall biosynthesis